MAKLSLIQKLKRRWLTSRRSQKSGFTLLELLVSMIIGSFLVALLLSFVVNLTQINSQDAGRTQVQQDMQAAMDYMAQDLREAVFVYNGDCLRGLNGQAVTDPTQLTNACPGLRGYVPDSLFNYTPVLAFWRTERLPQAIQTLCATNAANLGDTDPNTGRPTNALVVAGVPCLSGTSYSLVVYALDTSTPSGTWRGQARIRRYKLSQFTDGATSQTDQNVGYVNPLSGTNSTFQQWPYGSRRSDNSFANLQLTDAVNPGKPTNSSEIPVLVDFVDNNQATVDPNACAEFAASTNPPDIANALSPMANPPNPNNMAANPAFFACVRNGGHGIATGLGQNQDVLLTLVGNVTGTSGGSYESYASANRLAPLQTRVMVRGVVNKSDPSAS
jgi:prepilin-type N-terminal cleavage/methylation domain-containing protein